MVKFNFEWTVSYNDINTNKVVEESFNDKLAAEIAYDLALVRGHRNLTINSISEYLDAIEKYQDEVEKYLVQLGI